MERMYRRPKRQAVSLTSLLDLLFVMIFVSLIQQQSVVPAKKEVSQKTTQTVSKPTNFDIKATFNFYGTSSNPGLPSGKYIMAGKFSSTSGDLQLGGIAWIERPPQYDMVPLSGKIDLKNDTFTGRIEAVGCKLFTLKRQLKRTGNPLSGEWVGTYDCSQGTTGLTLTVE